MQRFTHGSGSDSFSRMIFADGVSRYKRNLLQISCGKKRNQLKNFVHGLSIINLQKVFQFFIKKRYYILPIFFVFFRYDFYIANLYVPTKTPYIKIGIYNISFDHVCTSERNGWRVYPSRENSCQ